MTYKQKKLFELHQGALSTTVGHNASHVRADTVMHSLADSLDVNKSEILDIESGNAAVRLALGEAKIIEENKKWAVDHGISLEALDSNASSNLKRSNTAILVKNLPYGNTTKDELAKLFGQFSDTIEISLPPSKTLALIKFDHGNNAKKAFKRLAYKRFKHVPLYLEWGALLEEKEKEEKDVKLDDEPKSEEIIRNEIDSMLGNDEDNKTDTGQTLYIKNLNFKTTEEQLRDFFERAIPVKAVTIPKKHSAENSSGSKSLSMGYGFVEFDSVADAKKAIKLFDGKMIQGHMINVKMSTKQISQKKSQSSTKIKNTKIMVRNVPFQTTRSELMQLFGNFGQLKKVRLPKKFDGTPRGFAFVDFVTHNEAVRAMDGLSKTHLYGRHLVLEWAEKEETVNDLREKAKRDINKSKASDSKKQNKKIRFNEEE